jgi:transglutaminase-like putative cysteine protease
MPHFSRSREIRRATRARRRSRGFFLAGLVLLAAQPAAAESVSGGARTFEFVYSAIVGPIEAGRGPVHVFIPLARPGDRQRIVSERIEAAIPGEVERGERYGNRFWHGVLEAATGEPIEVRVETTVERQVVRRPAPAPGSRELSDRERSELALFLAPNRRVVVADEVLDPILAEVRQRAGSSDPAILARATYDWVVDNVQYKKVGTGWGNGDTIWACNERYGNCTDFHALFISLARTQGIPARFEIGFPVSEERREGAVGGYHCWVKFYLPETGWFPIDASEAFKHPEKRELFYGTHPADRIHFSTGRDLRLGRDHHGGSLNYFIYPYVEVDGAAHAGPIEKSFSFRDVAADASSVR